jgi:hypothetical protein
MCIRMVKDVQRPIVLLKDEFEVITGCGVVDGHGQNLRDAAPEQFHRDSISPCASRARFAWCFHFRHVPARCSWCPSLRSLVKCEHGDVVARSHQGSPSETPSPFPRGVHGRLVYRLRLFDQRRWGRFVATIAVRSRSYSLPAGRGSERVVDVGREAVNHDDQLPGGDVPGIETELGSVRAAAARRLRRTATAWRAPPGTGRAQTRCCGRPPRSAR